MHPPLPHATLAHIGGWLCRRYRRLRVTGPSMLPLLQPAEEVLVDPAAYTRQAPAPGDLVVAIHPHQPNLCIIKRIRFIEPDGRCYLQGDNSQASSDSRQFGLVDPTHLRGKVVCRFP